MRSDANPLVELLDRPKNPPYGVVVTLEVPTSRLLGEKAVNRVLTELIPTIPATVNPVSFNVELALLELSPQNVEIWMTSPTEIPR